MARQWPENRAGYWKTIDELADRGKRAEVIPIAEKLVRADKDLLGPTHPLVGESLDRLARLYRAEGNYPKARAASLEAAKVHAKAYGPDDWRALEAKLLADGDAHAIALPPDQSERLRVANQQASRARERLDGGRFRDAIPDYEACIATFTRLLGPESYQVLMKSCDLASCHSDLGQYERARATLQRTLAITEKVLGRWHPHYARVLNNMGQIAVTTGDYDRAERLLRQALGIDRKAYGPRHESCAYELANLGTLYRALGDHTRGIPVLTEAVETFRERLGPNHPDYAVALSLLGNLYTVAGEYDRAEAAEREAVNVLLAWGPNGHPSAAMALNNLSAVYQAVGDYAQAALLLERAQKIVRASYGEDHEHYASVLSNLAVLYTDAGWYDRSIRMYEQALAIQEKMLGKDHPACAGTVHNLGLAYLRARQPARGEKLLERAAELHKARLGARHPVYADDLQLLAGAAYQVGDYPKAERLVGEAVQIRTAALGPDTPDLVLDLRQLAEIYVVTDRDQLARDTFARVLDLEDRALRQAFGFATESALQLKTAFANQTVEELLSFALARPNDVATRALAFNWVLRRKAAVLDVMCRYRALQRTLAINPLVANQAVNARRAFDAYMGRLSQPVGPDENAFRAEVHRLRVEYGRQEADLHRALGTVRPSDERPVEATVAAVRDRLPPGVALVELMQFTPFEFRITEKQPPWKPNRYVAFILTSSPTESPGLVDLGESGPIDRAVQEFREALTRTPRELPVSDERLLEAEFRGQAAAVSRKVFAPLRTALGDTHTVYLAPDGVLNLLPFDALVENDRYLIESYRFRYLSSGRDLLRPRTVRATGTAVFAGPDFDWRQDRGPTPKPDPVPSSPTPSRYILRGVEVDQLRGLRWRPLPGATQEADDIRTALDGTAYGPVRTFRGADARKEAFKEVSRPRLLHVATHGFFLPNQPADGPAGPSDRGGPFEHPDPAPTGFASRLRGMPPLLRSGLVFAGANQLQDPNWGGGDAGWLTAEEVALMDLRGTELVVLSACESGLGDIAQGGEGVFGLRRSFLYAGAENMVVSLFKVPDVETRLLMQGFYRRLGAGTPPTDALHEAKRALIAQRRQKNGAAHPFFWASFIAIGGRN